jgi:hypothetical protein
MLIALLVSGACAAVSAPAMARDRDYGSNNGYNTGSSFSINIDLGSHPQWRPVRGSRVYQMSGAPSRYDAFRYGGYYYVYDNNQWYRSHRTRGQFAQIDDRFVPREFQKVSRDHWRNASWQDQQQQDRQQHDRQQHDRGGHHS